MGRIVVSEKPRNHLDLRNRLDSKGQRRGKVIDYRVSELRVVELLDGLCEKMQDYTLQKVDSKSQEWIKVKSWENLTVSKQEARAHSKAISSYCGRLLEETEDEASFGSFLLAELIKKGSVELGAMSKALCEDLSQHCRKSRANKCDVEKWPADGLSPPPMAKSLMVSSCKSRRARRIRGEPFLESGSQRKPDSDSDSNSDSDDDDDDADDDDDIEDEL
ncbi:Protein canopy-like protein 1 [Bienertia sinuspersici]